MPNYQSLQDTTERLILGAGRLVQIEIPGAAVDVDKPWQGVTAGTRVEVAAVFVAYSRRLVNGASIQEGDQACFVAAKGLTVDLSTALRVIDGTKKLQVVGVRVVRPGGLLLSYELHVR